MIDRNALKKHLPGLGGVAILMLALYETAMAVLAPLRAPSSQDWAAAAAVVRAQFRPGDLIVAAPAWADQVMRLHLGDLVGLQMATRLDDEAYGRVWELGQRGAQAAESAGQKTLDQRHGGIRLRRFERAPARVAYDFVNEWRQARVSRRGPAGAVPCTLEVDRHQCPDIGFNWVRPDVLEMDFTLREVLYAQPVAGAAVVLEFDHVPMGKRLTVGAGLANVWLRKSGQGKVKLQVEVADRRVGEIVVHNRSEWRPVHLDTLAFSGQRQTVRFIITSDEPFARHFGFAAEARE